MAEKSHDPGDPTLDSTLLRQLAKSRSRATQQDVARNPNTPAEVLHRLWLKYPGCLLENPILTLWEVSSPDTIPDLIGQTVLLELFNFLRSRNEPLPEGLFDREGLERLAATALDDCNASVFEVFPTDSDASTRRIFMKALQENPRCAFFFECAPDALWRSLASDPCTEVACGFAVLLGKYDPGEGTPTPVFVETTLALAKRKNAKIHQKLARCPFLPPEAIDLLHGKGDARTRSLLAGARLASPATQRKLAEDPSKAVRVAMAKAATQSEVLRVFRMDDDPAVLGEVLANKKTPNDVRCRIVREAPCGVQEVLCDARNYLALPFYSACKQHLAPEIRARICRREGLQAGILLDLVHDVDEGVRLAVVRELEVKTRTHSPELIHRILDEFLADPSESIRLALVELGILSHGHIHRLLCDGSENVRSEAASAVLKRLADLRRDKLTAPYEKLYLEYSAQLTAMAEDSSHKVRLTLAMAPEAPPNALWSLYEDPGHDGLADAIQAASLPLGYYIDQGMKIANRKRPSRSLVKNLAESMNPFLRHIAAKSDHATLHDLRRLASDSNPRVAEAAAQRLEVREFFNGSHRPASAPCAEFAVS